MVIYMAAISSVRQLEPGAARVKADRLTADRLTDDSCLLLPPYFMKIYNALRLSHLHLREPDGDHEDLS